MEKVKAFVIKYQLWFKLAAIALLVATIFFPFYVMVVDGEIWQNYSIWYYATNNAYIDFVRPLTIAVLILLLSVIILSGLNLFFKRKQIIITLLFLYLFTFVLITIAVSCVCVELKEAINNKGYCIPNLAYYLAILLFFADIITLWQIRKDKSSTTG